MKLMSKDIPVGALLETLEDRLRARGLLPQEPSSEQAETGVEPRVDPLVFNLRALESHADPTQGLPLQTHRGGVGGAAVLLAKRLFRKSCQLFINEALARQRIFNGHVRDSYAQLAAEVAKLKAEQGKAPPKARPPRQKAPARRKPKRVGR